MLLIKDSAAIEGTDDYQHQSSEIACCSISYAQALLHPRRCANTSTCSSCNSNLRALHLNCRATPMCHFVHLIMLQEPPLIILQSSQHAYAVAAGAPRRVL